MASFIVFWHIKFAAFLCMFLYGTLYVCPVCVEMMQVFGLGNKTYENYNSMGKFVDRKLEELGAERVFELGLADDDAK